MTASTRVFGHAFGDEPEARSARDFDARPRDVETGPDAFEGAVGTLAVTRRAGTAAWTLPLSRAQARGLVMELDPAGDTGVLRLAGADRAILARHHETDIVAEWRLLGARLGLPLLVVTPDGAEMPIEQRLGEVAVRPTGAPRRVSSAAATARRPRFLRRRKTAALPVQPARHREAELCAGR